MTPHHPTWLFYDSPKNIFFTTKKKFQKKKKKKELKKKELSLVSRAASPTLAAAYLSRLRVTVSLTLVSLFLAVSLTLKYLRRRQGRFVGVRRHPWLFSVPTFLTAKHALTLCDAELNPRLRTIVSFNNHRFQSSNLFSTSLLSPQVMETSRATESQKPVVTIGIVQGSMVLYFFLRKILR